jgi:3-oxoacyl-[acyl-carrier-protein] synthase-3
VFAPVKIVGVAKSVPERIVTNVELESLVDTSDEWIKKRTGIHTRRVVVDETANGMAIEASREALAMSGIAPDDVGIVVACTITGENLTPSMAGIVQKALGIEKCAAFDVSAGCTGFLYALVTAASLMDTLDKDSAIVVASEAMSNFTNWTDRSTCVLFGDGAGALVLKRDQTQHLHAPILNAFPDTDDVIVLKKDTHQTPFSGEVDEKKNYIEMKVLEETLRELMLACGDRPYTKIVPHQANEKIIDYVKRSMRLKKEQFFVNISDYANTSSASVPIALCDAWESGWLNAGDRVALVGFGSGLTSGGAVIDWTIPNKKEI